MTAEVISRRAVAVPDGFRHRKMDLAQASEWTAPEGATVVSLLPLWILAQYLPRFIGVGSIVAISSTSVFSKAHSADANERNLAALLATSEQVLKDWCAQSHAQWTVLRPTMIYDGKADRNIARMARFIRRFRMLPLAAPALGLRQPIHADDVAKAILGALDNPAARGQAFNLAGGETIPYRAMAERVFKALGMSPRLLMLPTRWLMAAFRVGAALGLLRERSFGGSIFLRMNEDLVFDAENGQRILNYAPRRFEPEVKV